MPELKARLALARYLRAVRAWRHRGDNVPLGQTTAMAAVLWHASEVLARIVRALNSPVETPRHLVTVCVDGQVRVIPWAGRPAHTVEGSRWH